jgi:hypothetical protein
MHRDDHVRRQPLELDYGVIDMAARGDNDEPASLDDVAGRVFIRMLVGDETA